MTPIVLEKEIRVLERRLANNQARLAARRNDLDSFMVSQPVWSRAKVLVRIVNTGEPAINEVIMKCVLLQVERQEEGWAQCQADITDLLAAVDLDEGTLRHLRERRAALA